MEIHQLRYLVALAQDRNFRRAAKRVTITQPTLSQQIKKLELELGTPLFERSAREVRLTTAGKKFLPFAISILERLEAAVEEVRQGQEISSGRLTVAAIPTIAPYLLPKIILRLKKTAPRIRLEIYEETTSVLMAHLKEGGLDLGILALPVKDKGIVSRSLGREEFYAAVSKNHPWAAKKNLSRKDLSAEKLLILQEGHCFSDQALDYCKRSRDDDQIIFQGSSLTSLLRLTATGDGVTLIPAMAIEHEHRDSLRFIPLMAPKPTREIGLIWRVTAPSGLARQKFIQAAEEAISPASTPK